MSATLKHHTKPSVAVIVLAWNSSDCIVRCLTSLQTSTYPINVYVIDNASTDNTKDVVRRFKKVAYRNSGSNLGYAGGNNVGLAIAQEHGYDYAFLVNPDAYVAPDCIQKLVAAMESDSSIGLASPKIYYADSNTIWFAGASLDPKTGLSPHIGQGEPDGPAYDQDQEVPRANGCALLVRMPALQRVGMLDERYFLYFEEIDWSLRFAKAGYRNFYVASAHAWHAASSSTGGYYTPLYQYYTTRNGLLCMREHSTASWWAFICRHLVSSGQRMYRTLRNRPRNFVKVTRAIGKGYVDFTRKRFGMQKI